jgi:hypothetical protein
MKINMKQLNQASLLLIFIATLSTSCNRCKECTLKELAGTANETTTSLGQKCGDELDEIDGKTYIAIDGPVITECE